jgi:hypothetical protein
MHKDSTLIKNQPVRKKGVYLQYYLKYTYSPLKKNRNVVQLAKKRRRFKPNSRALKKDTSEEEKFLLFKLYPRMKEITN